MTDPRLERHFERVRSTLGSRPDEGWLFGVCAALARRLGWELWALRLVAVIALLSFTLLTALAYFTAAMLMEETRRPAQARMRRWAEQADRLVERVWSIFSDPARDA